MPATNELLQEGRYRINQEFLHEGKGTVYEAYDTVRDANVVVKEIPLKLDKVTTPSQQEILKIAFTEQARILTEITHDSLLNVHDYFSEIDRLYVVMESVDGDDLRELMERNKRAFPVSDVTAWADQLLDALGYLHTYKLPIIHRNIRPRNIKLNSLGMIKLVAIGFADGSEISIDTTVGDDTPDSGTINYAPLEQIWGGLDAASRKVITNKYDERSERILNEPLDARSDIYSLGATLYHLVTSRQPVDALERVIEILDGKPDPLFSPDKIDPTIPSEVSDVLMKAMEIKREYRFDSAAIMRQVLRAALIRVAEREAEEAREPEQAANEIKLEGLSRNEQAARPAEEKNPEAESGLASETDLMEQKLRDAEVKRLQTKERAAEAEKRLRETEIPGTILSVPIATLASSQDDLLEILDPAENLLPIIHFEDPRATEAVTEEYMINESPVALHLEPDEAFVVEAADAEAQVVEPEIQAAFVPKVREPRMHAEVSSYSSALFGDQSAEPEKRKGFSFGLPAIAIGAAAACIAAIGIWMFMGSSPSEPVKTNTAQSKVASGPASANLQSPASETNISPADQNVARDLVGEATPTQPGSTTAPTAQATAAKIKRPASASKAPAQPKKAVTADDLINDN